MSLFKQNLCQFGNCGLEYGSLYELLAHIEEAHVGREWEGRAESAPAALPLSAVCPVFAQPPPQRPRPLPPSPALSAFLPLSRPAHRPPSLHRRSLDPDDDQDSSNDALDHQALDPRSLDPQGQAALPHHTLSTPEPRPFLCPQPGCGKKYKNIQGMKYHQRNAHSNPNGAQKTHRCPQCFKEYKTPAGLQNHINTHTKRAAPDAGTVGAGVVAGVGATAVSGKGTGGAVGSPVGPPPSTPSPLPPPAAQKLSSPPGSGPASQSQHSSPASTSAAALGGHHYHQAPLSQPAHHHHTPHHLSYHRPPPNAPPHSYQASPPPNQPPPQQHSQRPPPSS